MAIHLLLWTFLPALLFTAVPLDVVEGYFWGHEWQWGYHKHPPLAPWLLEAFYQVFDGPWSAYLLSQVCVIGALWAVWVLARPIVGGAGAALSVLALELNFYYTAPTIEFNPNVLQMPLWALAILSFHRALAGGRWRDFLLLGLCVGLLIYTKYSAVILALAFCVVAVATAEGRSALKSPKLYAAAALSLALALPHFVWIVASDYLPFSYALSQKTAGDLATRLYFPLNFLAAQVACHLAILLVAGVIWLGNRTAPENFCPLIEARPAAGFDRVYVLIMAVAPLVISMVLCFAMGIEFLTMWGMPMFNLSGLALVVLAGGPFRLRFAARLATAWLAFALLLPVGLVAGLAYSPALTGSANRNMWPARAHAVLVAQEWRAATGQPLAVVAGDIWSAGLVALYAPDRPSVLIEGDLRRSPWIDPDRLAETGFAVVWRVRWGLTDPPEWVRQHYPDRIDLGLFDLAPPRLPFAPARPAPYATIGIAVIEPQPRQSASSGGSSGTASITAQ